MTESSVPAVFDNDGDDDAVISPASAARVAFRRDLESRFCCCCGGGGANIDRFLMLREPAPVVLVPLLLPAPPRSSEETSRVSADAIINVLARFFVLPLPPDDGAAPLASCLDDRCRLVAIVLALAALLWRLASHTDTDHSDGPGPTKRSIVNSIGHTEGRHNAFALLLLLLERRACART